MTPEEKVRLRIELNRVFNPAAPVDEKALFAGRLKQITQLLDAISQRGRHAIIYGERGVGKTSLANVLRPWLEGAGQNVIALRVNADGSDTFTTLWRKMFAEIQTSRQRRTPGFLGTETTEPVSVLSELPENATPDDVRRILMEFGWNAVLIMIVDEFDRLHGDDMNRLFADTIKTLSDHSVRATIVLVGVGRDVDELIKEHRSIDRALVQIHLPRMLTPELYEIIDKGMTRLGMTINSDAREHIALLSQGLPYYTHMLALYAGQEAIAHDSTKIDMSHVEAAIKQAIDAAHQSIRSDYHKAVSSPQKGNLYRQVLLACAQANTDEMGCFTAADVREPVRRITGNHRLDIPNFAQHLTAFCEGERGLILEKLGRKHRFQFRFRNPLMQPFVMLRGYADGMIKMRGGQV